MANEPLLRFEAQPAGRRARGDDHGARLDPLAFHIETERALGKIGFDHGSAQVLGPEGFSLALHVLHQLGTVDAIGETGEVLHQGGEGELATGVVAAHHQGLEIGPRGVDGGGVAGAARADD